MASTCSSSRDGSSESDMNEDDEMSFCGLECSENQDGDDTAISLNKDRRHTLANRETRAVHVLRVMTFLVLVAATVLCSFGIYEVARSGQEDSFEQEYYAQADNIIESFHASVEEFMGSFDALSSSITSFALDSGSTFPNVTVPNFDVKGSTARIQAQATFIFFMPLVTDETRRGWEEYATANQGHLMPTFMHEQGMKIAQDVKYGFNDMPEGVADGGSNRNLQLESVGDQTFREEIWGTSGNGETEAEGTGPYLPIWQISPVLPLINFLNANTLDLIVFSGNYQEVLSTSEATIGFMTQLDDPTDENGETVKLFNALLSQGQYRHDLEEYSKDPVTSFAYPVFDNFTPERKVVGVLGSALYWRLLFKNVLASEGLAVIDVVIYNSLGQASTYRIDGPKAIFVGDGDLHDPAFDEFEQFANIADYVESIAGPTSRSFTAVDLNSDYISYDIHIYPTADMEANYLNNVPVYYSVGVLGIFIFAAVVFLAYNYLVEKRQKMVVDKALKSSAVVDSLFPANIQKRLYDETEFTEKSGSTPRNSGSSSNSTRKKDPRKEFSNSQTNAGRLSRFLSDPKIEDGTSSSGGAPIADLFPDATVFFADLVGFTKWSSKRTPCDVFGLLEGLYGAFDKIAQRRKVFKVETIGDCYVAVTGLPEAQPDHAVIMAKFAAECLVNMRQLLVKMSDQFGSETLDLNIRIGIHSGPVTAGVLRGVRARFQLFGDTVNTAARMESNGVPGRIQCSQTTADCLLAEKKIGWLKPREDLVKAKGKGEMRTYWIEPSKSRTNRTSQSESLTLSQHSSPHSHNFHNTSQEITRSLTPPPPLPQSFSKKLATLEESERRSTSEFEC